MAYSRGASALGVAVALGEIDGKVGGQCILRDFGLFSSVASTSAGIELMHNVAIVLGNSASSASPFEIGHAVMRDAIDSAAVIDALKSVGKSALETAPSRRQAVGWLTSSPRRKPRQTAACADFVTPCLRTPASAGGSARTGGASRAASCLPDIVTVGKLMGNGHLGGRGTIAAGGDRGQAHPLFQHLWRQHGVLRRGPCGSEGHQGRQAAGADQRDGK